MKNLFIVFFVAALSIGFTSLPSFAGSPANKATGYVTHLRDNDSQKIWTLSFSAHEAKNNRPPKGMAIAEGENGAYWEIKVSCVQVLDDDEAIFGGVGVGGTQLGKFVLLYVIDGGGPGISEDYVFSTVRETESEFLDICLNHKTREIFSGWEMIDGNLQVHFNP
jgi:hypothetical protein